MKINMAYSTQLLRIMFMISIAIVLQCNAEGAPLPLGKSKHTAHHVRDHSYSSGSNLPQVRGEDGFSLSSLLRQYLPVIPNTYYDIPKHRYPYYDENGTGRLLYGYGGKTLYKYTVFKPLEGYFKKR